MANERLREALLRTGLDIEHVAAETGVDQKTVERWITKGRMPYPRHRHRIASLVHETESYLWPAAVSTERRAEIAGSEVVKVYPHRSLVPTDLWNRLLNDTSDRIDVLVLAGLFFAEEPSFAKTIKQKVAKGVSVRMLFGDPNATEAKKRSAEERLAEGTVSARIQNALALITPLARIDGVELRYHSTTLYNSVFRFDDEMIVNMHVYGLPGAYAPVMHLRKLPGGDLFDTYTTSFEHVWATSEPAPI
ncbi:helix-turn-helix domain-containing protein [Nocardia sp. alder85J]|uniref:helix-turn-helix domain-containing protein n=1 Tax=Nocardia sp. alder85J TaxID=2862949 RepID=UPI001CD2105A|nr:helix-turn-helix transcriptional regulator [Nocardia sp. alder85J]MCX4093669.1 helix-turn-helix transcriptional regulator [Nocardia sp. alder85J]